MGEGKEIRDKEGMGERKEEWKFLNEMKCEKLFKLLKKKVET